LKRSFRLAKSTDFQRVRQLGKSFAHPLLVLIAQPSQQRLTRFGVAASRSVGKAVQRNRAKRLMRAAIQANQSQIPTGWDIVLIARRPLAEATFHQTQAALQTLLRRANLIQKTDE
jgi:ribonuclease P protein component